MSDRDEETYSGLFWGAAGISDALSKIKPYVSNEIKLDLEVSIQKGLQYVWGDRLTLDDGTRIPAWTKYPGMVVYPGQKYGAAGIIKIFSQIPAEFDNNSTLNFALQIAHELMSEARNSTDYPNWAYSYTYPEHYEDISITDLTFGSLGIIDSFLDLYSIFQDPWIIKSIELMYNWLDYTSRDRTIGNGTFKILPWFNIRGSSTEFRSSYSEGNAGAIETFLRLYDVTGNMTYYEWAEEITNAIMASQLDLGSWPFFIDNPGVNSRISWKDGSVGILHSLLIAQKHGIGGNDLNEVIQKGIHWLSEQFVINDRSLFLPEYVGEDKGFSSYSRGLTGVLRLFREYGSTDYSLLISKMIDELLTNIIVRKTLNNMELVLANVASIPAEYYDLSWSDGLAGIAIELVNSIESIPELVSVEEITQILSEIAHTYVRLQQDDGSWVRQIYFENTAKKTFYPQFAFGLSIFLITLIRSKKRISQLSSF